MQIWFNWGADINVGQMEVMQRITQILNSLPPGILQPFIVKFDVFRTFPAFVTASGGDLDERARYDLAYNTIAPQIEQIANVARHGRGRKDPADQHQSGPSSAAGTRPSILDVVKAVKASNLILPSGDIGRQSRLQRIHQHPVQKPWDINDVVRGRSTRVAIRARVRDVGVPSDVRHTNQRRPHGRQNGLLRVNKQPIANTVEVVDAFASHPENDRHSSRRSSWGYFFDQSIYIRQSIKNPH